jgi:hypothetical protein
MKEYHIIFPPVKDFYQLPSMAVLTLFVGFFGQGNNFHESSLFVSF